MDGVGMMHDVFELRSSFSKAEFDYAENLMAAESHVKCIFTSFS
jgi:hypothetical protein